MLLIAILGFVDCTTLSYDGVIPFNTMSCHRFLPALAGVVPLAVP